MDKLTSISINNKKILIRVDYNVPIESGKILSDFRIQSSLETIIYCLKNNASVIIMSHLGRPKGIDNTLSLKPILYYLKKTLNKKIYFSNDPISEDAIKQSNNLQPGEIHLLENLRFYKDETANSRNFAKILARHADIYINDAFGTAHRAHASNSAILEFFKDKGIGFLLEKEICLLTETSNINNCLLLGGAKISTKLGMIKYFLDKSSLIIIGGGMAFTFLKAKGYNIGKSLLEEHMLSEASAILESAKTQNIEILLPIDVNCSLEFSNESKNRIKNISKIESNEIGLDIGPKTIKLFTEKLHQENSIIWNGPMGAFELNKFSIGTEMIANCISKLTKEQNVKSIVGGGDTASAVINMNLEDNFTHVSTGGGASLRLLSGQKLELIESWKQYEK